MTIRDTFCCGVKELDYIEYESSREIMQEIYESERDFAFILFTATSEMKEGRNLAKYIKKHKLGSVTRSPSRINPNTHNHISVWVWSVNHNAINRWGNKHCKIDIE